MTPLSQLLSPAVTVWSRASLFVQVTVPPAATVAVVGAKRSLAMDTAALAGADAGVGVGVVAWGVVGGGVTAGGVPFVATTTTVPVMFECKSHT